jgi:pimeloyl-ACP methyl ester carboxylesterase
LARANAILLALIALTGCATVERRSPHRLNQDVALADMACRNLDTRNRATYNNALVSIAYGIDAESLGEVRSQLNSVGVSLDLPVVGLPLSRFHAIPQPQIPNDSSGIGIPLLLEYDTSHAPLYPPDGLLISATAIYRRINGRPQLALLSGKNSVELNGSMHPLNNDNAAPIAAMSQRGQHVAQAGFSYMLHPTAMHDNPGIFLTEPYDPNKIPVLMVHGLQSTPFAFADLMKAIRRNPELAKRFQIWTFLYGTGTPVLFNALELRQQFDKTIAQLDPHDHDFATRHIVVVGHSMGGLMLHTLVSSSDERLWNAMFAVPPQRLKGDKVVISLFAQALHFRRNPRVVGAIFAATPHRGSNLADSWMGHLAESLIRLPASLQTEIVTVVSENRDALKPAAKVFDKEMNFTSVHTLSPRDPVLLTLAGLPIEVPFHSIIGQQHTGPIEKTSDGVVPYSSAHLNGAASELVVHSGHGVCENPDAQAEVLRVLRLQLPHDSLLAKR